jgi:hypothetical protein
MDPTRFDAWSKALVATAESRRGVVRVLAVGALGAVLSALGKDDAEARKQSHAKRRPDPKKKKKGGKKGGKKKKQSPPPPTTALSPPPPPPPSPPAAVTPSPPPPPPPPPPPSPGTVTAVYDVTMDGTVRIFDVTGGPFGPIPFNRAGALVVRTPFAPAQTLNGSNAVELCFQAGDPRAQGGLGAILFGTNDGCFQNRLNVDQTYVSQPTDKQVFVVQDLVLTNTCKNVYYHPGSQNIYAISDGAMLVEFRNAGQTVVGVIQADGLSNYVFNEGSRYEATFSGQLRQ